MEYVIDPTPPPAPTAFSPRQLEIRFTGSGSEYFRIWIVNLLLIIVTLGLYLPFAKTRRIRYFYANTQIDGQALGFHGDPWKMFRGFLLLVVLMGAYGLAGRLSPVAALVAFILLCVVWPALWRASMQFRLANTSWRGMRMGFTGDLASAYRAVAPLYVPLIAFIGLSLFAEQPPEGGAPAKADPAQGFMLLAAMAAVALATPWFIALTKRYQHSGYRIANQQAAVDLPVRRVYGLCLKGALIGVVPLLMMAITFGLYAASLKGTQGGNDLFRASAIFIGGALLSYFAWFVLIGPYFAARLQNLVWNGTRSRAIGFDSQLRFKALLWLTLKNWTLVLLTLGLYRPFAAVNTARLRLEAVSVAVSEDPATWSARRHGMEDATGEAAGDFFGIDMGL